jgi:Holliday junction DNA helicase RuvA
MISYLKGILQYKSLSYILVEVGGIGCKINLPLSNYEALPPEGEEVKIHTYLYLREDKIALYGFLSEEERDFFLLLISLPNIGPKSALRILSKISPFEFKKAIKRGDLTTLTGIPGIGKKTAQRLMLELEEKIGVEKEMEIPPDKKEMVKDALSALISLGYTHKEAREAVEEALKSSVKETNLAKLIKESLRHI